MEHVDRAVVSIEEVTGLANTSGDRLKDIVEITALSADMVRAIATARNSSPLRRRRSTKPWKRWTAHSRMWPWSLPTHNAASNSTADGRNPAVDGQAQALRATSPDSLRILPVTAGEFFYACRSTTGQSVFRNYMQSDRIAWRQPRCRRRASVTSAPPAPKRNPFFCRGRCPRGRVIRLHIYFLSAAMRRMERPGKGAHHEIPHY